MKLKLFQRIIRSGALFLVALLGNIYAVQAQTVEDVYLNLKSLEEDLLGSDIEYRI